MSYEPTVYCTICGEPADVYMEPPYTCDNCQEVYKNVSPELALYVERCRVNISVECDEDGDFFVANRNVGWFQSTTSTEARGDYLLVRSKLLAAYLPPAPERGQLTDITA